jgi:hypothetical protein
VLDNPSLIPRDKDVVVYCTCPGDKTNRTVLRRALLLGFLTRQAPQRRAVGVGSEGLRGGTVSRILSALVPIRIVSRLSQNRPNSQHSGDYVLRSVGSTAGHRVSSRLPVGVHAPTALGFGAVQPVLLIQSSFGNRSWPEPSLP